MFYKIYGISLNIINIMLDRFERLVAELPFKNESQQSNINIYLITWNYGR